MLKDKKETLLIAHALVGIIQKAGEALDGDMQFWCFFVTTVPFFTFVLPHWN